MILHALREAGIRLVPTGLDLRALGAGREGAPR